MPAAMIDRGQQGCGIAAMNSIQLAVIGRVVGGRTLATNDDRASSRAAVHLDPAHVTPAALLGIVAFSHAEILFQFKQVSEEDITTGARRPRGNPDWPLVGIFAQRGRNRPNRLGISICRIVAADGLMLDVEGLDAIDGTPVLDIKPVMHGFLPRGAIREPDWARAIMAGYWQAGRRGHALHLTGSPPHADAGGGRIGG
jgi:tRNA (Thr-GGU) A37 N-methylase